MGILSMSSTSETERIEETIENKKLLNGTLESYDKG